ncbi:MAG: hypothetical protein JSU82_18220 [Rhodospirillales bacterium]|nr:MAG: hypothetical protein JSU82_18220 [Rhodospirillales bacterium]
MQHRKLRILTLAVVLTGIAGAHVAKAQDDIDTAQANNPLANFRALNLQDYYIGELSGTSETANQFWLRYAQPFSVRETDWLMRLSVPINTFPTSPTSGSETGLGDTNVFAAYLFDTASPAISFGLGPTLTVPTATKRALGSEKWSAGIANVLFDARSPKFQYGYLLTWLASFAGESSREDVNLGALQPFAFYQLGNGTYLRSAPIWTYNFENGDYSVPIGLGIGKVFRRDATVFNLFIEPQVSIADEGFGQPEWQIFFGLNMQFAN